MVKKNKDSLLNNAVLNRDVIFMDHQATVRECISVMIEREVSSVLVHNQNDEIVGIFTERDVVRKFTLLGNRSKLEARINTVMSRPVIFADQDKLEDSLVELHFQYGFRHFPIRSNHGLTTKDVVGILTVTDVFRKWCNVGLGQSVRPKVYLLSGNSVFSAALWRLLELHALKAEELPLTEEPLDFIKRCHDSDSYLVYDLDFFSLENNLQYLGQAKQGKLILLTTHDNLVKIYREHLDPESQHIFMKPLDVSYLCWLMQKEEKPATAI